MKKVKAIVIKHHKIKEEISLSIEEKYYNSDIIDDNINPE